MIKRLYSQYVYDHQKDIIFYFIYALLLIGLLFTGLTANISASSVNNRQGIRTQKQAPVKTYPLYHFKTPKMSLGQTRTYRPHHIYNRPIYRPAAKRIRKQVVKPKIRSYKFATKTTQNKAVKSRIHPVSRPKQIIKPRIKSRNYRNHSTAKIHRHHTYPKWFRDGLDSQNFSARNWVSFKESGHRWNVISYGHRCIGYFQLDPDYLGYKNGHVNLNHRHQVKVADQYAANRYGDWIHAKAFWQIHHWY